MEQRQLEESQPVAICIWILVTRHEKCPSPRMCTCQESWGKHLLGDAERGHVLAGLIGAHALALKEGEDVLVPRQEVPGHHDEIELHPGGALTVRHGCHYALHRQALHAALPFHYRLFGQASDALP